MPTGKVKWFDAEKGFGFLSQEDGPDVYVRADALPEGMTTLKAGTRVEFGIAQGRRGDQALQVRILDAPASVAAQPVARPAQEARRDGPDRRGPDPAARRRRRGLPPRPAPRPQHRRARPPSCSAPSPTSWSSELRGSLDRHRLGVDVGLLGARLRVEPRRRRPRRASRQDERRPRDQRHDGDGQAEPGRVERASRCRRSRRAPTPAGSVVSLRRERARLHLRRGRRAGSSRRGRAWPATAPARRSGRAAPASSTP